MIFDATATGVGTEIKVGGTFHGSLRFMWTVLWKHAWREYLRDLPQGVCKRSDYCARLPVDL